jgi:hypothetical protein
MPRSQIDTRGFIVGQTVRELDWPYQTGTIQHFDSDNAFPEVGILVKNSNGPGKDSLHTKTIDHIVAV